MKVLCELVTVSREQQIRENHERIQKSLVLREDLRFAVKICKSGDLPVVYMEEIPDHE